MRRRDIEREQRELGRRKRKGERKRG